MILGTERGSNRPHSVENSLGRDCGSASVVRQTTE